jgi:hypothetical protein
MSLVEDAEALEAGSDLTRDRETLRAVQLELRAWRAPADRWEWGRLWHAAAELDRRRVTALADLVSLGQSRTLDLGLGYRFAKMVEIEVADGWPLALCVGPRVRSIRLEGPQGALHVSATGCLHVFPDSLATSGYRSQMWPRACAKCHARKVARDQQRRLQARIDARRFAGLRKTGRPFDPPLEPE